MLGNENNSCVAAHTGKRARLVSDTQVGRERGIKLAVFRQAQNPERLSKTDGVHSLASRSIPNQCGNRSTHFDRAGAELPGLRLEFLHLKGPKGRPNLALGKAQGSESFSETRGALKGRPSRSSVANVALVILDFIRLQEAPILLLEAQRAMMSLLVLDVLCHLSQFVRIHREAAVAALPVKPAQPPGAALSPSERSSS
jgi:hypothetical protein